MWASLAATPAPAPPAVAVETGRDKSVAVVDANAIISMGLNIRSLAEVLYTTEDILAEIRDSKSRQAVEAVDIVTGNPSAESLRAGEARRAGTCRRRAAAHSRAHAVSTFAKLTGDLHQLSREDLRLLALAHTLETDLHGSNHLRKEPVQVRRTSKLAPRGKLPGWGTNGQSEEWDAIDAYDGPDGVEDDDMRAWLGWGLHAGAYTHAVA